jgi:hypothetical protein
VGSLSHQVKASQSNLTKNAQELKVTTKRIGEGSETGENPLEATSQPLQTDYVMIGPCW